MARPNNANRSFQYGRGGGRPEFQRFQGGGRDLGPNSPGDDRGQGFQNRQGSCNNPMCPNYRGDDRFQENPNAMPPSARAARGNFGPDQDNGQRRDGQNRNRCPSPRTGMVAEELYGAVTSNRSRGYDTCCDTNGCGQYRQSSRCCFWPSFAHPRWLSCQELYSCQPQGNG